ncbi:phage tail protein, partial [Acinetobacter baumannii]
MMMIFGVFVFSLPTATYQTLKRQTNWRHASNSRVGDMPDYQFVGRGDDVITLDGSIMPEF